MKETYLLGLVENEKEFIELAELAYADHPYVQLVRIATNIDEAMELIDDVDSGRLKLDGLLVDANLSRGKNCGEDAKKIYDEITARDIGSLAIIGFSSVPMKHYDHDMRFDADIQKNPLDIHNVLDDLAKSA